MKLYLVRGLPGSGKSTFAKSIGCFHVEADMYHVREGKYSFNTDNIVQAHSWCKDQVEQALEKGIDVAVSNTFTTIKEIQFYLDLAEGFNAKGVRCRVSIYWMHKGPFGNKHRVPELTLAAMAQRWEAVAGEIDVEKQNFHEGARTVPQSSEMPNA